MPIRPSPKEQPGATTTAKASAVELAVLLTLCPIAGIGAGLAFASALVGFGVAGIGLIAVAAYAVVANVKTWPAVRFPALRLPVLRVPALPRPILSRPVLGRPGRRDEERGLSVTDISTRRRAASGRDDSAAAQSGPPLAPEPDVTPVVAPTVIHADDLDRVVPFRLPPVRL
jgi:hypothetical protein